MLNTWVVWGFFKKKYIWALVVSLVFPRGLSSHSKADWISRNVTVHSKAEHTLGVCKLWPQQSFFWRFFKMDRLQKNEHFLKRKETYEIFKWKRVVAMPRTWVNNKPNYICSQGQEGRPEFPRVCHLGELFSHQPFSQTTPKPKKELKVSPWTPRTFRDPCRTETVRHGRHC